MEDVHPDLYAVISKDKLDYKIDSIKKTIPESLSEVEVYKVINTVYSNLTLIGSNTWMSIPI